MKIAQKTIELFAKHANCCKKNCKNVANASEEGIAVGKMDFRLMKFCFNTVKISKMKFMKNFQQKRRIITRTDWRQTQREELRKVEAGRSALCEQLYRLIGLFAWRKHNFESWGCIGNFWDRFWNLKNWNFVWSFSPNLRRILKKFTWKFIQKNFIFCHLWSYYSLHFSKLKHKFNNFREIASPIFNYWSRSSPTWTNF